MFGRTRTPSDSAPTHAKTGTDQLLGERCAEGVQFVRALRGSVEQVTDGDGAARRHHIQRCGAQKSNRESFILRGDFHLVYVTILDFGGR